ncbi:MAG: helix-turn-helix domain-containing protein [Bacteroidales bacterium]|nr:helix-turn-helix domain-containing protein [Bacteroidales bacterium]
MIEIGKKIRERRNTLRITQPHLAEMAGISESTLHRIENGKANPTIKVLNQIVEILGLEITLDVKK